MQPNETARRPTEIRDARHRLLAAVTTLVELHRRPDPTELVRDRAVVSLQREPRTSGGNAKCFESEDAGRRASAISRGRERQKISARNENLPPSDIIALRIDPGQQGRVRLENRLPHHGPIGRHIVDLDAQHESHRCKEIDERLGVGRFHVNPDRFAIVDELQVMFDVTLRAENQRLRTDAGCESFQALRRQVVQPRQPVDARDSDDAAMRQIHESGAVRQLPLLAERIAVVGGHSGIESLDQHPRANLSLPPLAGLAAGCGTT